MLMEKFKDYIPILVILFLLGGVYLGYSNVWICVAAFVIGLTYLNKNEFVFFMILGGTEYFGVIGRIILGHFTLFPQFVCYLIVLLIIYQNIIPIFRQNWVTNYLFLFLIMAFVICYIYGPQHAYSTTKLIRIVIYGFLCFWVFMIYNNAEDIDVKKLAYIYALVGVTYIVVGVDIYHFGNPTSILDFNYFRLAKGYADNFDFAISYHSVGLAALYGIVFLLSNADNRFVFQKKTILLFLILIYIAFVSQMRQGILGIFVIIFFRYILLIENKLGYKLIGLFLIFVLVWFLFNNVESDAFQAIAQAKNFEQAVNRPYEKSLAIIEQFPMFGLGLGGYSDDGRVHYPHNIFLEIINEMGFVGLFVILIISLYAMWNNRFTVKMMNANGSYAILLFLALFIRVNASSDLAENIYFFALLFSMKKHQCFLFDNDCHNLNYLKN